MRHLILALVPLLLLPSSAPRGDPTLMRAEDFRDAGQRGFNLDANTKLTDDDLRAMRSHGANLARLLVVATRPAGGAGYALSTASLAAADRYAALGAAVGFRLVLALEPLPNGWHQDYWEDPAAQQSIVEVWRTLAARYKGNSAIAGYDLINEPIATTHSSKDEAFSADGAARWTRFATELIAAIRQIDPDHAVIVEPSPGALPAAFSYLGAPLEGRNLVYSVHMYEPARLTHQGISYKLSPSYPWPSDALGATLLGAWGEKQLAATLDPVRDFATRTHLPIYVGEFSIVRWAPGETALHYLADVLGLIDGQLHWSWTYHSWRECDCWDAEIPSSFFHQFPYLDARPVIPRMILPRAHRGRTDAILLLESYLHHQPTGASSHASRPAEGATGPDLTSR